MFADPSSLNKRKAVPEKFFCSLREGIDSGELRRNTRGLMISCIIIEKNYLWLYSSFDQDDGFHCRIFDYKCAPLREGEFMLIFIHLIVSFFDNEILFNILFSLFFKNRC